MAKMTDKVKVTCYGTTKEYTRKQALKEFREAIRCCEGSERDRYVNIVIQLEDGATECTDLDW